MPQKLMPDFTAVGFCSPFLARQPRGAEIRNPKSENRRKSEIRRPKDLNIEHRTSNIEHRTSNGGGGCLSGIGCWMLDVRCSMFDVSFFALLRSSGFGFGMARADFRAALRRDWPAASQARNCSSLSVPQKLRACWKAVRHSVCKGVRGLRGMVLWRRIWP